MPGIYDEYKIALLDSSFFVSNFSESVKNSLLNIKVYVADTFNSEIEQYKLILSSKRQVIYDSNVRFLNENMRLYTLNLDSFGAQSEHLHNDMWGLVTLLVGLNAKFVIITANQVLIQKIVLNGLKVDVYDLNIDGFIKYSEFSTFKSKYKIREASWITPPVYVKVAENMTLFCKDHSRVTLSKKIKTGYEADLYLVKGESNLIAKIFKKDQLSAGKFQNIKRLIRINEKLDINWAIFPTEVLYFDSNCTSPAGFIETYVLTGDNLDDNPLFSGNLLNVTEDYLSKQQSYVVELCLKIVRQVCYLNTYGFYISDYNMGNFALIKNNDKNIQMWDTDSFGYESFFGKFFSSVYVESINHPKYDIRTKIGAIDISNDALYQFVFVLLSLGDSPISEHTSEFKYDKPDYYAIYRKKFFPMTIWKHFEDVFRGKKVPSAEALMQQLIKTNNQLRQNPAANKTFKQLFIEVIPEYKDVLKELEAKRRAEKASKINTGKQTNNMNMGTSSINATSSSSYSGCTSNIRSTSGNARTSSRSSTTSSTKNAGTGNGTKKKSKLKIAIIILLLLAILVYYISTIYTNDVSVNLKESTTEVVSEPKDKSYFENIEYVDWTKSDAVSDIKAAGWNVNCVEESSWTKKNGLVISDEYTESNKTVTLYISSGPERPDDVTNTGAKITVSKTDIVLSKGQSIQLTVTASGDCPDAYYFSWQGYTDIKGNWGDWIDNSSASITFTGNDLNDTGYVRFRIMDGETKEAIGYTDIFITVQ